MKRRFLLPFMLLSLIIFQPPTTSAQDFPDVCQQPENILPNCNFDNGMDRWQTFLEDGAANFSVLQGGGGCHAPRCPAAYIVTESHFVGGLYQQVPVAAGNAYYANIVWLAFDSLANDAAVNKAVGGIGRRVGIDPFGGTDPRSPQVIWSPDNWRNDCKICFVEQVTVTAQADTITVFVRIDDTWRLRAAERGYDVPPSKDQFWLDDIGMKQVEGNAAPQTNPTEPPPPPPTDTPLPPSPTDAPVSEPPSDTPLPPTGTPAEIVQAGASPVIQSVSPIETPAATNTVAPPPTLTPTVPALPTNTSVARTLPTPVRIRRPTPVPAASSVLPAELLGVAGSAICAGGVVLLILAVILAGLVWLYRLGWGNIDDEVEEDDNFDDEEIIVEIVE